MRNAVSRTNFVINDFTPHLDLITLAIPELTPSTTSRLCSEVTSSWRIVLGVLWKPRQLLLNISTHRHSLWL